SLNITPGGVEYPTVLIKASKHRHTSLPALVGTPLGLLTQTKPEFRLMAWPFFKSEMILFAPGCHIQRHHGCLNQQGAGATHRINEVAAGRSNVRPTGTHQQCRCEVFLQGRQPLLCTVSTHMQAMAT